MGGGGGMDEAGEPGKVVKFLFTLALEHQQLQYQVGIS